MKLGVRPAFAMQPDEGRIAIDALKSVNPANPGSARNWIVALATDQPCGWEAGVLAIVSLLLTHDFDQDPEDYGLEAVKHLVDVLGLDVLKPTNES